MSKITDSINELIISTAGGILVVWGGVGYMFIKALNWCGAKLAEGAIGDFINKVSPDFEEKLEKRLAEHEEKIEGKLDLVLDELRQDLRVYREVKHRIEGELMESKNAIVTGDEEKLKILKEIYERE